ncbi:MAG: hypothetical protein RBR86_09370 [Pseudobdellovibrionaceae bacterium]|jgi:hypothetical protein|nr:hypothetical protein [Pseudobdellovibrionaceae bacterium]
MKLSALSRTRFQHSAEAIEQVSRDGIVTRKNFKEAYESPECKDVQIEYGKDPLSLWISHLGLSDGKAAKFMGVSRDTFLSLRNDPSGAFNRTSPEMVINFCRRIKVHPAHLGSLEQDYRQSLPPYITAANILIAGNSIGEFGEGDCHLAAYALRVERARFSMSFSGEDKYADVAHVLEKVKSDDLVSLFNFISREGKLTSEALATAEVIGENLLEKEQDRLKKSEMDRDFLVNHLGQKYLEMLRRLGSQAPFISCNVGKKGKAGNAGLFNVLLKDLTRSYTYKQLEEDARVRTPRKSDVRLWVSRFYDGVIREDYNRMLSRLRMHKEIGRWKVELSTDIRETTDAIYPYLKARTEFSRAIGGVIAHYEEARATVGSVENWLSEIQAGTMEGQILQRLFANHMIMTMGGNTRRGYMPPNVWNSPDPH